MRHYHVSLSLSLTTLLLWASCGPGTPPSFGKASGPPPVDDVAGAPARKLGVTGALPEKPPRPAPPLPLKVIHRSPVKSAEGLSAVTVTFNQPMVRLGRSGAEANPAAWPMTVAPAARGALRWVAGDTAKLALTAPLQNARRYRVTVPTTVKSLSGSSLAAPVSWTFETPRPRLVRVILRPAKTKRHGRLLPGDTFEVLFNLRVDPAAAARSVALLVNGARWPFTTGRAEGRHAKDPKRVLVRPSKPLPVGAKVALRVMPGLESAEGPLTSTRVAAKAYEVYGPLTAKVFCDGTLAAPGKPCWPMSNPYHGGLSLEFSEPVCGRALLRGLRLTPGNSLLAKHLRTHWPIGVSTPASRDTCAKSWSVGHDLALRREHRLTISPTLQDAFGQHLGKQGRDVRFTTRGLPPDIFLPQGGPGLREPWHPYSVKTVNVKQLQVQVTPFRGERLVTMLECLRRNPEESCTRRKAKGAIKELKVPGRRDRVERTVIKLPRTLSVVHLRSPQVVQKDKQMVPFSSVVVHASMGVHARLSAYGVTAWVTRLRGGQGLKDAVVQVYHASTAKLLATTRTDPSGLAEIPRKAIGPLLSLKEPPRLYVLARAGGEQVYVRLDGDSPWRSHRYWDPAPGQMPRLASYYSWEGDRPFLAGYVSTERGIYRPGDRVHAHGAVRRYVSHAPSPLAGAEAHVELQGAAGQVIASRKVRLGPRGVFATSLSLPTKGRLGRYAVNLRVGDQQSVAMQSFRVAEYREPRFGVKLSGPRHIRAPQKLNISAAARYFFGGAMGGAAYRLSITREPRTIYVPGRSGFHAGAPAWDYYKRQHRWHLSDGVLDKNGALSKAIDPGDATGGRHDPWPCAQYLELEVTSASRRSSAARLWVNQLPGDLYVAYKHLPATGKVTRRRVMVFEPSLPSPRGSKVVVPYVTARRGRVQATLYPLRKGKTVPDWSGALWKKTLTVSTRGVVLEVPWRAEYDELDRAVLVLSVTDARGREARTAQDVRAPTPWGSAWDKRRQATEKLEKRREAQLTLSLDKDEYLPGQTATLTVKRRGWSGDAVLFVERERIYGREALRFDARGVARAKVPVLEHYTRSVNLRVVGLRKGARMRGELGPVVSTSKELVVSSDPFLLKVGLTTDRKTYRPGQKVTVDLRVADGLKRGRQSRVVIMAVDEAVLRLTHFSLPDPYYSLARTPPDGVLAEDIRAHLLSLKIPVHPRDHASGRGGGGTGMGTIGSGGGGSGAGFGGRMTSRGRKQRTRRRFLTTAWHATLVTDATGRARASFTLPDNLTEYRLMAFAVDHKRSAGAGRASITVDLPMLSLAALPRLLRVGDTARAGVVLYNTALPAGKATVTARVSGKAVALSGPATATVQLPRGSSREVRFPLAAKQGGEAKLTFSVTMGKVNDAVQQTLRVARPTVMEASSVSGQTRGAVAQGLARLQGLRPDVGALEVRLASTALTGVEDGMDQLVKYPYGCLEQQASRLLPMMAAVALGRRFSLELPGDPAELIGHGLRNVLAMQRIDGGFGYWPGSRHSWPFATAYALVVLHRARMVQKATGVAVPADAVNQALTYLAPHARHPKKLGRYWFARHSFVLLALALHGKKIHKGAKLMFDKRQQKPLFARAMLLSALAASVKVPDRARMIEALTAELSDSLRVDGTWAHAEENLHDGYKVLMHSDDRTSAMVLLALLHAQPKHPMIPRLVRWFLLGRKQARFRNTQEAAWALLAFWDYARILEKDVPDFEAGVWLGDRRLTAARFAGHSVKPHSARVPMARLLEGAGEKANRMVFAKRGKGTLYYVARLRYAPKALPQKPKDHGMSVQRALAVLDKGGRAVSRPPRLGDTVLVTVKVNSTEARRYVVVQDPLPAGLEALDATLATGSRSFGAWKAWADGSHYDHRELRDDRVLFFRDHMQPGALTYRYLARVTTPGTFVKPPAKAEEMYTPEVYGYTAAARVTFRK